MEIFENVDSEVEVLSSFLFKTFIIMGVSELKTRVHEGSLSSLLIMSCMVFVITFYLQHLHYSKLI